MIHEPEIFPVFLTDGRNDCDRKQEGLGKGPGVVPVVRSVIAVVIAVLDHEPLQRVQVIVNLETKKSK